MTELTFVLPLPPPFAADTVKLSVSLLVGLVASLQATTSRLRNSAALALIILSIGLANVITLG